jgi:glucose dehydrogenase
MGLMLSSMMRSFITGIAVAGAAALAAPGPAPGEWTSIHGGASNQRFAALDQINLQSIASLGAAWVSEPFQEGATSRMTPLEHEGLMFLAAGPRIIALNAQSGKQVWTHQTETRRVAGDRHFVGDASASEQASGLAITRAMGLGLGGGMIFAGLMNGHVIALNEKSGEFLWEEVQRRTAPYRHRNHVCAALYRWNPVFRVRPRICAGPCRGRRR